MMKRQGFLLVSVLLITVILLTLGLTFLGKRAIQYRRAALYENAAQARAFAETGLDDALTKFRFDLEFPPLAQDQDSFTYAEEFLNGSTRVGGYKVTIDGSRRLPPHSVWLITSVGDAGPRSIKPLSQRALKLELDVATHKRTDTTNTDLGIWQVHPDSPVPSAGDLNPNYYRVINFQDLGGL